MLDREILEELRGIRAELRRQRPPLTQPVTFSVSMANANEEYAYEFPPGTVGYEFKLRGTVALRYSFQRGAVATSAPDYEEVPPGVAVEKTGVRMRDSQFIYFACSTAGKTVEGTAWVEVEA